MRETPERLPYEPMDERQRAIDMVRELEVTKDGDVFDLIARLMREVDQVRWIDTQVALGRTIKIAFAVDVDDEEGVALTIDDNDTIYDWTLAACIDAARKGLVE